MQVAQKGEFRYIGKKICQYCSPIVQTGSDTGSKMIANGCFPAGDRLSDRPTVPEMKEKGVLGPGPGLRDWKSHGNDQIPIRAAKIRIEADKHQIKFFCNNITGS